jgi:ABC-type multidrug transport system fused ATPase/permease subunit
MLIIIIFSSFLYLFLQILCVLILHFLRHEKLAKSERLRQLVRRSSLYQNVQIHGERKPASRSVENATGSFTVDPRRASGLLPVVNPDNFNSKGVNLSWEDVRFSISIDKEGGGDTDFQIIGDADGFALPGEQILSSIARDFCCCCCCFFFILFFCFCAKKSYVFNFPFPFSTLLFKFVCVLCVSSPPGTMTALLGPSGCGKTKLPFSNLDHQFFWFHSQLSFSEISVNFRKNNSFGSFVLSQNRR